LDVRKDFRLPLSRLKTGSLRLCLHLLAFWQNSRDFFLPDERAFSVAIFTTELIGLRADRATSDKWKAGICVALHCYWKKCQPDPMSWQSGEYSARDCVHPAIFHHRTVHIPSAELMLKWICFDELAPFQ